MYLLCSRHPSLIFWREMPTMKIDTSIRYAPRPGRTKRCERGNVFQSAIAIVWKFIVGMFPFAADSQGLLSVEGKPAGMNFSFPVVRFYFNPISTGLLNHVRVVTSLQRLLRIIIVQCSLVAAFAPKQKLPTRRPARGLKVRNKLVRHLKHPAQSHI